MLTKLVRAIRWVGEHWVFSMSMFLLVAITVTTIVTWNIFGGEQKEEITVYLYVSGLGEEKDIEGHPLTVYDDDTLANVFMGGYPEIQETYDSIVRNHTLDSFMGVNAGNGKTFTVSLDGTPKTILESAYVYNGAKIEVVYG
ncbi:MAG: hypothetical protein IJN82_00985 [Clostridia bacterium]|nr:hypothetical protein [Clostridia bacterium]